LDTATLYESGVTEIILGDILTEDEKREVLIDTKANPWDFPMNLTGENVINQLNSSLQRLGVDSVNVFYLHGPDRDTPIFETLRAVQDLYEERKFKELGLSNFCAFEVVEIYYICEINGWVKPTVYQGLYNLLSRSAENELFPALRKYGIRFYAFNTLCGGLLTGKYDVSVQPTEGRFVERIHYKDRYWHPSMFSAVDELILILKETNISPADASLRWLAHHSYINIPKKDGIIIGQTQMEHLTTALSIINEPLPEHIANQMSTLYQITKMDAPIVFKPFPVEKN